jgi:hypothetical protein
MNISLLVGLVLSECLNAVAFTYTICKMLIILGLILIFKKYTITKTIYE